MEGCQSTIKSWPGDIIKPPHRRSCLTKMDEVLVIQGIYYLFPGLIQFFSLDIYNSFPNQFIRTLSNICSTLFYTKIKHRFNTIVNLRQTQIVPPPAFHPCICHICYPPYIFFRLCRSIVFTPTPFTFLNKNIVINSILL